MAARRLVPLLDRVLVEKIVAPAKSAGGVLLPESAAPKVTFVARSPAPARVRGSQQPFLRCPCMLLQVNEGVVLAVGPGRRTMQGELISPSVKEGDKVLLPDYGGAMVKLGDKE